MRVTESTGIALHKAFDVQTGVTAFVGGGGKTTAMLSIAHALSAQGSVLVTTSTHIFPPVTMPVLHDPSAFEIENALMHANLVCIGTPEASGKLSKPSIPFAEMRLLADYVLVEADGAKGMPLKAPATHEPVLPKETALVIAVAGLDGIGRTIREAAFRPALYAAVLDVDDEAHIVLPSDAAAVLCSENGQYKDVSARMRFSVLLNKADDFARIEIARKIALALDTARVERTVIASCKEMRMC